MDQFTSIKNFEDHAMSILPEHVKKYYQSGVESGETMQLNKDAFRRLRIRPRLLRNVSKRDISLTVLGERISMPLGVSPTGNQKWAHPSGECANAKAAESAETIFIMSSYSNSTFEEVVKAAPKGIKWLQIILHKDRNCNIHFIRLAEKLGFKAIVVTIDCPILPKSKVTKVSDITDSPSYVLYEDYLKSKIVEAGSGNYLDNIVEMIDDSMSWEDITWLKSITKLPLVLKGILTANDAISAVKYGASAILVSNHGGRQLDSVPATIEALPEIVRAVGDKIEVYLDGGITRGTDIFKALALGARMVFVGRAVIWGLACGGEEGARAVLEKLRKDIDETFAMSGCSSIQEVTKDLVMNESLYNRL